MITEVPVKRAVRPVDKGIEYPYSWAYNECMAYKRTCVTCGVDFEHRMPHAAHCSKECHKAHENKKWGRNAVVGISPGTVGAMSEMSVAIDMMNKGYAVFRALSPACLCDLIAIKGTQKIMVEVRTGYRGENGKVSFPTKPEDNGRHDIYAVYVRANGTIYYFNTKKTPIEI